MKICWNADSCSSINFCSSSNDSKRTDLGFRRRRWQKECSMRKVVLHRQVERKRRQRMSNLNASLHHQIKKSVGDELEEVEGHIKKMEKNIELRKGRDHKLKSWFESSSSSSSSSNVDEISVTVNKIGSDGMEILIKTVDVELSRVLAELQKIDDELDVVTIVSTRINGKFLYKIQLQARDMKKLGVLMLQDRLIKVIM